MQNLSKWQKQTPLHIINIGLERTPDPLEYTARIRHIHRIMEEWDGTEDSAKKTLERVELWMKNSNRRPVYVGIPE
jgi:hypothetical protein